MKNSVVVYTAIFGTRDVLLEPRFVPPNVDFVCFTDQSFTSDVWEVRRVPPPLPEDLGRSNRYYKILAHRVLPEYEYSVYIDGNVIVTGDVTELIATYLTGVNLAGFDHALYTRIPLHSVAEQAAGLLRPGQDVRNKESFENIRLQAAAYVHEGFPDNGGLLWTMTLVRRHNEPDVIETMEAWWAELLLRSKRDQMSFNYVAWKHRFSFRYIPMDGSDNPYVLRVPHYQSPWKQLQLRLGRVLSRMGRMIFMRSEI